MANEDAKKQTENIQVFIEEIQQKLKKLPSTEFNYYIALLIASIKNEAQPEQYTNLLQKTQKLINEIEKFYMNPDDALINLHSLTHAVNELIETSSMHSISHQMKRALLGICGVVTATLLGVTFGLVGLSIGLFTNYNIVGNIKGAGLGFLAGLSIGLLVGYRSPSKLLQKDVDTKLEFCIDNITRLYDEVKDRKTHEEYKSETKEYILDTFFKETPDDEKEARFQEFLDSKQQFQICTTTAGHVSKSLKGYLGHHSFIRFSINGVTDIPMEYGDRKKTPNFVDQSENERTVTGQKLFEMLTLDRRLQDTHAYTLRDAIRIYEIGSDDCRTYVDKILIGTEQEPTTIGRFSNIDKWAGKQIVAPLIRFFSKTKENELHSLIEPDAEEFKITLHKWKGTP